MKKVKKLLVVFFAINILLSSCGRDMNSNVYTSSAPVGKVLEGVVVSARPVKIKDNDKLQDNTLGMVVGGLAGGVGGAQIGKGKGQLAAAAGLGLAGAALGAVAQDKLSTSDGMEYVVRLDSRYIKNNPSTTHKTTISYGDNSVDQQIKDSIDVEQTKTDLISVVQGKDTVFQPGQRVLIIYNNDRPRLAAAGY